MRCQCKCSCHNGTVFDLRASFDHRDEHHLYSADSRAKLFTLAVLWHTGDGDGFLSIAECQYIIKHDLDTLRAKNETHVPGYTQMKLYPGKSISKSIIVPLCQCWCLGIKCTLL